MRSCGTFRRHLAPPGVRERSRVLQCQPRFRARGQSGLVDSSVKTGTNASSWLSSRHSNRSAWLVSWEISWLDRGMRAMRLGSNRGAPCLNLLCDASSQKHSRNCYGIPAITSPLPRGHPRPTRSVLSRLELVSQYQPAMCCDIRFHVKHISVCRQHRFRSQQKEHPAPHSSPSDCSGFHPCP